MYNLTTQQKMSISVVAVQGDGTTPGAYDSPPQWTANPNTGIVSLHPSADGLSCEVWGVSPGLCQISVSTTSTINGVNQPIQGLPFYVTVATPPIPPATQLTESFGPIISR